MHVHFGQTIWKYFQVRLRTVACMHSWTPKSWIFLGFAWLWIRMKSSPNCPTAWLHLPWKPRAPISGMTAPGRTSRRRRPPLAVARHPARPECCPHTARRRRSLGRPRSPGRRPQTWHWTGGRRSLRWRCRRWSPAASPSGRSSSPVAVAASWTPVVSWPSWRISRRTRQCYFCFFFFWEKENQKRQWVFKKNSLTA